MEGIHISLKPEVLWQIGPVGFTNSMFTMFIVMALLIIVGALIARSAKPVPGRAQGVFELVAEFLLSLVEATGGYRLGRQIFPLIGAIFCFIAIGNYTGILPGVGSIGFYREEAVEASAAPTADDASGEAIDLGTTTETLDESHEETEGVTGTDAAHEEPHLVLVPLFRPPNADINMTLAMSVLTFVSVQVLGIRAHGLGGRLKHMADPPFLFPIEVISELSRIVSLSARLFGNVFAGEVLLGVIYAMVSAIKIAVIPLALPVVFIGLELLFGTIQALVFALLTLIYIALAASEDEHGAEHGAVAQTTTTGPDPAPVAAGAGD